MFRRFAGLLVLVAIIGLASMTTAVAVVNVAQTIMADGGAPKPPLPPDPPVQWADGGAPKPPLPPDPPVAG